MFELDRMEAMLMLPFLGTMLAASLLVAAAMIWGARRGQSEPAE